MSYAVQEFDNFNLDFESNVLFVLNYYIQTSDSKLSNEKKKHTCQWSFYARLWGDRIKWLICMIYYIERGASWTKSIKTNIKLNQDLSKKNVNPCLEMLMLLLKLLYKLWTMFGCQIQIEPIVWCYHISIRVQFRFLNLAKGFDFVTYWLPITVELI